MFCFTVDLLVVVIWKSIHSRSDTNRTGAEGLFFYYPRLLYCPDQMLAVMLLSQHRVSSSKTVKPCAPCGAQYMVHAIRTWSVVCSVMPHLEFGEETRPYLCMDKWNHPTPVLKQLSLTQNCLGQANSNRPGTCPGHKNTEPGRIFAVLHIPFIICPLRSANAKSSKVVEKILCSWHKWASTGCLESHYALRVGLGLELTLKC